MHTTFCSHASPWRTLGSRPALTCCEERCRARGLSLGCSSPCLSAPGPVGTRATAGCAGRPGGGSRGATVLFHRGPLDLVDGQAAAPSPHLCPHLLLSGGFDVGFSCFFTVALIGMPKTILLWADFLLVELKLQLYHLCADPFLSRRLRRSKRQSLQPEASGAVSAAGPALPAFSGDRRSVLEGLAGLVLCPRAPVRRPLVWGGPAPFLLPGRISS